LKEQPLNKIKVETDIKNNKIFEDHEQITIDKIIGSNHLNYVNNNSESNDLISLNGFTF
jgi:hypothetical protein